MKATPAKSLVRSNVRPLIPGRPTQRAAAKLKDICLEAALAEFFDNGFQGATIDGVAKRAKTSRTTVYRMFGDKEAMFRAVHHWYLQSRQSDLRLLLEVDLPSEEMLQALLEKIYLDSIRPRDLALTRLFVAEAHRFPDLTDSLFEHSLFEPLIQFLTDQAKRGILDIDDPVEAAWDVATLAGGGIKMLIKKPVVDPKAVRARSKRVARWLVNGWLIRDAAR